MTQQFHLIAPRAKVAYEFSGGLEQLFEEFSEALVRFLAVPISPQRRLYFPKRPTSSFSSAYIGTVNERVMMTCGLAKMRHNSKKRTSDDDILVDFSGSHKRFKFGTGYRSTVESARRSTAFVDLPTELHLQIIRHIDAIEDVVCLSLSSRQFWDLSQEWIIKYYVSLRGRWAGHHIICVDDEIEPGDFPPGLFSEKELHSMRQDSSHAWGIPGSIHCEIGGIHQNGLASLLQSTVSESEGEMLLAWELDRVAWSCSERANHQDPVLNLKWNHIRTQGATYFPEDQPWILRNLTTKEFVRSEAVALKPQYIHGPNIDVLGFGDVLLHRILWSRPSGSSPDMYRGVWAGHRFDIVALAQHEDCTNKREWRDASHEIAQEIATI
ncbi:hypothetical protein ED733_004788 [Metarhizium rileyi]|uniref:F-box domain-containing protein n=1 Tax=Metarhizium rileyi (strain RCEF 4871) TaxID=1649241 RepID=A0A5C6GCG2_METRR|nr:hypothetical protein ED733_004788 [Metarhizium rileyi]